MVSKERTEFKIGEKNGKRSHARMRMCKGELHPAFCNKVRASNY